MTPVPICLSLAIGRPDRPFRRRQGRHGAFSAPTPPPPIDG
ncbi:unnamed protein product [Spirodela intermedia]|uniref:Uncharacterized protein n=1 Tax=Spirodela intermedia TaxID=51605 RepID=A0ABN7EDA9_SPIIN|nr:unnamed protein product [Spirodela intermedia]CAA6675900.1 unnamed protein product [Spirodela intermedia]